MKKKRNYTIDDLFEYLDQYVFVGDFEIVGAVEDFYRKYVEGYRWQPSLGELYYFEVLADEYKKQRNIKRDD